LKLSIPTAKVFVPLLVPSRYKAVYGGRASGKSHFCAEKLIDDSLGADARGGDIQYSGLRSVCIREVQKTLKESAKRLIEDKLQRFELGERQGFKVYDQAIQTPGDGVMIFQGMQDHTAESIKSLEGFNRAWVEEAQTMSANSLRLLRPTIRAPGSELLFSWNPRRKTDPVDVMFRQRQKPTGSIIVRSNWSDNPWFSDEMNQERLDCLRDEPDQYDHIWEGGYVTVADGAYYAKHLNEARLAKRIGIVAEDPLLPFKLFVDIGGTGARSDAFVIWVVQFVGATIRCVNYYERQGQAFATHVTWLREQGYGPERSMVYLPHDGATKDRVHNVSYESAFDQAGYEVDVIPNQGRGAAKARIDEARRLFPSIYIDETRCEAGLEALGWYHEKKDPVRNAGLGPEHDWASHGADAFGLIAVVHELPAAPGKKLQFQGWG
jgi:phage terminase large subunit